MALSMVAMLGWIMPAPLAMPVQRTWRSPICAVRVTSLGRVSVVMMAVAAAGQPSGESSSTTLGTPASTLAIGSCTPITPVLITKTECSCAPRCSATSSAVRRALASPSTPVQALAQPALTTMAYTASGLKSSSRRS